MQLVEEATDGCWIGHRARMSVQASEIGSVYAPPTEQQSAGEISQLPADDFVETVIEVDFRNKVPSIVSVISTSTS